MTNKAFPWKPDAELPTFYQYIGQLKSFLTKGMEILTPFGPDLAEAYPHTSARDMRDLPHFSALIDMFAAFHAFQRPIIKIDDEPKAILDTMQDFLEAYKLLKEFGETTRSGLPAHILKVFHEVILPLSQEFPEGFTYEDLVRKHNEIFQENVVSSKTCYSWITELRSVGYVDTQPHPNNARFKLIRVLKNPPDVFANLPKVLGSSFSLEKLKKWWNTLQQQHSILHGLRVWMRIQRSARKHFLNMFELFGLFLIFVRIGLIVLIVCIGLIH